MRHIALFALIFLAAAGLAMPGPQGKSCRDPESGQEVPCADGKYHDYYTGDPQPKSCDNFKTGNGEVHDCECDRSRMCAQNKGTPGKGCKTECRDDACKCVKNCS